MALKDWKRIKRYMEKGHGVITYANFKINQEIVIHTPKSAFTSTRNYVVRIDKSRFKGNITRKEFKNKFKALAFAKKYMKSH